MARVTGCKNRWEGRSSSVLITSPYVLWHVKTSPAFYTDIIQGNDVLVFFFLYKPRVNVISFIWVNSEQTDLQLHMRQWQSKLSSEFLVFSFVPLNKCVVGEGVSVKSLPHVHQDLSPALRHPVKCSERWLTLVIAVLGRQEQPSRPRSWWEALSQKIRWKTHEEWQPGLIPGLQKCTHACTQVPAHAHVSPHISSFTVLFCMGNG